DRETGRRQDGRRGAHRRGHVRLPSRGRAGGRGRGGGGLARVPGAEGGTAGGAEGETAADARVRARAVRDAGPSCGRDSFSAGSPGGRGGRHQFMTENAIVESTQHEFTSAAARALLGRVEELVTPERLAHVRRVADLALRIGRSNGFSPEDLERVELAALLHDAARDMTDEQLLGLVSPRNAVE